MAKQTFEMTFAGRPLVVEVGQVAKQANGAVVVRYGDTTVLSTAVMSKKMATADFFPLQVNYEEKMYAAGKFPGGFNKREGRPSTDATLTARLIDRPIRPMFAEGFRNEVQVINTVLSYDENASAPMAAMFGSSLALSISDIPFNGPIAGVQVAYAAEDVIINPSAADKEVSLLDLTVAGTKEAINMVESGAQELSEDIMLQALLKGHEAIQELVDFQNYIVAAVGKEKAEVELLQVDADLKVEIETAYYDQLAKAVQVEEKLAREAATQAVKEEVLSSYQERFVEDEDKETILRDVAEILEQMEHAEVRRLITEDKVRPDGRRVDEIRPLDAEIDFLPKVHGSGLFTRGQTQALSVLTLAACGNKSDSKASGEKQTITVATDSDTAPFTFKKGDDFKGYDIDLVKAIFKDSAKYEVKFVTTPFDSILTGVDSGRYQIAANDFNYNEERAHKYGFSDPISRSNYAITSAEGTKYTSLDDLSGKTTEVLPGSNYAQLLENWNHANADKTPITINYASSSTGLSTRIQHIQEGKIDFILYDAISSEYIVKDQGYKLAVNKIKDDIGMKTDGLEYLLFSNDKQGKELKTFVNKRIKELKKDGTLAKLSKEYFGGDYVSDLK